MGLSFIDDDTLIIIAITAIAVLTIIAIIVTLSIILIKREQLRTYQDVMIGMTENEMLSIMGGGYNVSSLKNNRRKYEWRINSSSYGKNGYRSYSGVRKVDIYTKDGIVEEIKPYNV